MASRLSLYNAALTLCGERVLASLTENREPRRLLDQAWDDNGVKLCLEAGQWRFAMRTVMLDYDPDISPEFGFRRGFVKPTDWCATSGVCSDEYFNSPLLQYNDEAGRWYADIDIIYVRYVSNDAAYGGDLSLWTTRFFDYAAAHFASKIALKLTSDKEKMGGLLKMAEKRLSEARNHDAMAEPTRFPPPGNWSQSRSGRGNRNRQSRGQLIG